MSKNPIGLHIQAQSKNFNRTALLDHCKRADYTTCTILDDLTLAVDLAKQGMPYAVSRAYNFEPSPDGNSMSAGRAAADEAFGQLVGWRETHPGSDNVLFMVNCERGFGVGVSEMYAHLIERCATEVNSPIGLVVGNWASGAVKCGQAGEPNAWIDAAEPLLDALDKHKDARLPNGSRAFVIGCHEYTSIIPWIASNGGAYEQKPLWKDRPLAIDWTKPQYHLGRMAQGVMAACKHFGIADYPPMMITECLFDDMADVSSRIPNLKLAPGYTKPRGWRSLVPQWKEWYGKDAAAVLADFHIWSWETIYQPLGFVIGTHTFSYGNTGTWVSFQVDEPDAKAYRDKMEAYRPGGVVIDPPVVIPPVEPPPVIISPNDPRWQNYTALGVGSTGTIRAQPSLDAPTVSVLDAGIVTSVQHIPQGGLTPAERAYGRPNNQQWYVVRLANQVGWIRSDTVMLSPYVEPTPIPPLEPPPDLAHQVEALVMALELSTATLQAAVHQLEATITLNNFIISKYRDMVDKKAA